LPSSYALAIRQFNCRYRRMSETDLATLIRSMSPRLQPGVFVFVSTNARHEGVHPIMTFREAEGATLIVPREQAAAAGLRTTFPSRMITLEVTSSLEAVGFLAAITGELARAGIAVNPVSAFHHDHLFVPAARADEAMAILRAMSGR
jgi:uncharacterized protein